MSKLEQTPNKRVLKQQESTKFLINQAVKVLDGESAYNSANLDQHLMGI